MCDQRTKVLGSQSSAFKIQLLYCSGRYRSGTSRIHNGDESKKRINALYNTHFCPVEKSSHHLQKYVAVVRYHFPTNTLLCAYVCYQDTYLHFSTPSAPHENTTFRLITGTELLYYGKEKTEGDHTHHRPGTVDPYLPPRK